MRMRLVAACLAVACGAPQRPAAPPPPAYVVKHYAPLGIKADAKAPQHALILGTDNRDGSTLLPLAPAIFAVAHAPHATNATSAQHGADGRLAPGTAHETTAVSPRIARDTGVVDLVVATLVGKDVTDLPVSSGTTDASARAAIELLATLTGAKRAREVDGTLLPDGTIVAGTSVSDVIAAFAHATGKRLPVTVAVPATDMMLAPQTAAVLQAKYKLWQSKLAVQWGAILQLESAGRLPATLVYLRDRAKRLAEDAERLRKQNQQAAAYTQLIAAVTHATSANRIYDVLSNVQANRIDAAVATLDDFAAKAGATRATLDAIAVAQPTTIGGQLRALAACGIALRALAFEEVAVRSHASARAYVQSLAGTSDAALGADRIADAVVTQAGPAILYAAKLAAESALSAEQLELVGSGDVAYAPDATALLALVTSRQTASAASLAAFDRRVIEPFAQRMKIGIDEARQRAALLEVDYLVATSAATPDSITAVRDAWGETSLAWATLALARTELAYLQAAELVATHDIMGVPLDAPRPVASVPNDKLLGAMLAIAERHARQAARAARIATGAIPVQAKLAYQLAVVARVGTASDRLDALAQFWTSTAFSQLAVTLARN